MIWQYPYVTTTSSRLDCKCRQRKTYTWIGSHVLVPRPNCSDELDVTHKVVAPNPSTRAACEPKATQRKTLKNIRKSETCINKHQLCPGNQCQHASFIIVSVFDCKFHHGLPGSPEPQSVQHLFCFSCASLACCRNMDMSRNAVILVHKIAGEW